MRRWWWWMLGLLAVGVCAPHARAGEALGGRSTLLIEATTGRSLREDNADAAYPPGALSQLMVLLLSLENAQLGALPLEVPVAVGPAAAGDASGVRVSLRADRTYLLSDLLKAMLIGSADDATLAVAEAIAGSVPACLEAMNARAQRLGMRATHYTRLAGDRAVGPEPDETTTARDVARLAQALVRHPSVVEWASLSGLPFDDGAVLLRNNNQLIGAVAGVDGLHVASIRRPPPARPEYSIVATARRGSLRLIAVVLGATDSAERYATAVELLEWGFARYERLAVVRQDERVSVPIQVVHGTANQITPVAGETVSLLRRRDEEQDLQLRYQLPSVLAAPIQRDQQIGEIIVEAQGQLIGVVPMLSPVTVRSTGILAAARP